MADPMLTVAPITLTYPLNLSDAAGPNDTYDYLEGDNGSDWYKNEYFMRGKAYGGARLRPVTFCDTAAAITSFDYDGSDRVLRCNKVELPEYTPPGDTPATVTTFQPAAKAYNPATATLNWGLRWVVQVDQSLRQIVLIGSVGLTGAGWTFKVVVGDASSPDYTAAVATGTTDGYGATRFAQSIQVRSRLPTTVTIEYRQTSGSGTPFIVSPAGFIKTPIKPPVPRTHGQMVSMRNGVCRG